MPANPFLNSIQQLTLASIPQLQQAEWFLSAHNIISTFLQGILSALLTTETCRLTLEKEVCKHLWFAMSLCSSLREMVLVKGTNKFRWGDNVLTCWPEWRQDFFLLCFEGQQDYFSLPHYCFFTKAVTGLDTMAVWFSYLGDRGGCEAHLSPGVWS